MTTPKTPESTLPPCGDYNADAAATVSAPLAKSESSYIGLRRRSDEQLPRGPETKSS